jgi:hypothetical protein
MGERTECKCQRCVAMCERRPCWPTPAEARALIEAGYCGRLMLDWWERGEGDHDDDEGSEDILILCPAAVGYEDRWAPPTALGRCNFLTGCGLCEIHEMKPTEGAEAICTGPNNGLDLHRRVAMTWDTPEGRDVVAQWQASIAQRRGRRPQTAQSAADDPADDRPPPP